VTKKDHELIADVLKRTAESDDQGIDKYTMDQVIMRMAARLKQDNDRFDIYKFRRACGWPE
jgi:hypothetical protein